MYSDLIAFAVSDSQIDFLAHDQTHGFCPPREAATMPEGASYGQAGEVASEARRRGLAQRLFVYAPQTPPSLVALLDHKSSTCLAPKAAPVLTIRCTCLDPKDSTCLDPKDSTCLDPKDSTCLDPKDSTCGLGSLRASCP